MSEASMRILPGTTIPQPRGRAAQGRVKQLSHGRLCGDIETTDGQRIFFHGRDLEQARYNDLKIGDAVSFEVIDDHISGARATAIRLLEPRTPTQSQRISDAATPGHEHV
jgi:cold shock CspA family protein